MKKNILFGFAACGAMLLSANVATAQEAVAVEEVTITETEAVECGDHFYSERGANWFLQIGAGMELPMTDRIADGQEHHRHITASYNIAFGKWFSPYLAWRIGATGGAYHVDADGYNKAKYINANADLMWDMFNSFGSVKSDRFLSVIPFVGLGVSRSWGWAHDPALYTQHGAVKTRVWEFPVSVGLQLRFRLCKYVDFFAEGRYGLFGDEFDGSAIGQNVDMNLNVLGGFNINFGGREFKSFNPCDYLGYINQLNGQVNDLRGALATCGAALAAAEAQLPCPEVVAPECPDAQAPLLSTVRFTINSAKITSTETVNVYNIAQWMKANPNSNVVIKGYADKNTGTASYNMKLSERRAQNVYNMLTKEYGIPADRLTIKAEGSDSQVYDVNNWNRIVIFSQN